MGHRTIALLARKYLNSDAVAYYDEILANEFGYEWDDAATWPDKIKTKRTETKEWHYTNAEDVGEGMDTPPEGCHLNYPINYTRNENKGCIVSQINSQTATFLDKRSPANDRKEALMFLMHFLGDLHQPLHIENAIKGGKDIQNEWRNRHSDGAKDDEEKVYAAEWADRLYSLNKKYGIHAASECSTVKKPDSCSLKWARESNGFICKYVMQPNVNFLESNDLSGEYFHGAASIVEELVGKAGARLGGWLNSMHCVVSAADGGEVNDEQKHLP